MGDFTIKKSHIFLLGSLGAILVVAVLLVAYNRLQHEAANTDAALTLVDSEATPYVTLSGEPFTFRSVDDTVRVVSTWASWSPDARTQLATLEQIAKQYDSATVSVIAINRKEPQHRIEAFLSSLDEPVDTVQIVVDETDAYYARVEGYAMPETIVYTQSGMIVEHMRGALNAAELKSVIRAALDQ